jgi:GntR family transcriptional repressor for pyruvate dehydrogenase complex
MDVSVTNESRLRAMVRDFRAGDRLPTERALAEQFAISRTALRQMLVKLETDGLIWRHVGKGTFVGRRPRDDSMQSFFGDDVSSVEAVVEMREIVEPAAARLAAERAKPGDIRRMRRFLDASKDTKDPTVFNDCCEELHKAIAAATHNPLLLKLYEALLPVSSLADAVGERVPYSDEEHQFYYAHHRDIVEAIVDREPDRAERLMRVHVNAVGDDAHGHVPSPIRYGNVEAPRAAMFMAALHDLAQRFGETAFLVRQGDRVELVEAVLPSGGAGRTVVHPGSGARPPECATSMVLAAFNGGDPAVRARRFATSDRMLEAEVYCIAAPVRFGEAAPKHAIGLIGMRSRMKRRPEMDYVTALNWSICAVAAEIAETLGIEVPSVVQLTALSR